MRSRISLQLVVVVCAVAVVTACAGLPNPFAKSGSSSSSDAEKQKKGALKTIPQPFALPSLAPTGKTTETLRRGKVTISVATEPFTAKMVQRRSFRELPTLFVVNDQYSYEVTTTSMWVPSPAQLKLKIRIVNNLDDVLRLSGVLVRCNVDGKDYALDAESTGLKSLIQGVLAPDEQKEFELVVASAAKLKDGSNLSFRIYGVQSGSAKEKGNFEWTYRITATPESREAQVRVTQAAMRKEEVQAVELAQAREIAAADQGTLEQGARDKAAADAMEKCMKDCQNEAYRCSTGELPKTDGQCPDPNMCFVFRCVQPQKQQGATTSSR